MKTPLSWIKDFIPDLKCTDQEFVDAMTMSGTKCEGYEKLDRNLEKIVVGKIEKMEPEYNEGVSSFIKKFLGKKNKY